MKRITLRNILCYISGLIAFVLLFTVGERLSLYIVNLFNFDSLLLSALLFSAIYSYIAVMIVPFFVFTLLLKLNTLEPIINALLLTVGIGLIVSFIFGLFLPLDSYVFYAIVRFPWLFSAAANLYTFSERIKEGKR